MAIPICVPEAASLLRVQAFRNPRLTPVRLLRTFCPSAWRGKKFQWAAEPQPGRDAPPARPPVSIRPVAGLGARALRRLAAALPGCRCPHRYGDRDRRATAGAWICARSSRDVGFSIWRGLYFCGESGLGRRWGGFNFQWSWASRRSRRGAGAKAEAVIKHPDVMYFALPRVFEKCAARVI
jgi:hypothetical protein